MSPNEVRDNIDANLEAMINLSKTANKIIENYDIANPAK